MLLLRESYSERFYVDLKRRSLILAEGIEAFLSKLPPLDQYGDLKPAVKWVYVPKSDRYDVEVDKNGENSAAVRHLCSEIFPEFCVRQMREEFGETFWIWEDVRPSITWLENRLPQMYLLGMAIDCFLEGWTFEDDEAWQFGLSDIVANAGFDSNIIRPGQKS